MFLLQTLKEAKNVRCIGGNLQWVPLGDFKRERALLSKISRDPTVDRLRDKKENCSTRRGLRVGTGFREFPQTPRGRIFSLLEFYSHFKCFTNV